MDALLVITNVPTMKVAQEMARRLIQERLAACVNLLPGVHSVYHWQGVIEEGQEVTMLIKTSEGCYAGLERTIVALHPNALPEVVALPINKGLPAYLQWINQEAKRD